LSNQQPTDVAIADQAKTVGIVTVDPAVVKQLQDLQDNSVNVQSLFNEARNNPFQQ
jgi:hypothetical protein